MHITNSLQGFTRRITTRNEVYQVHVGNGNKVDVAAIGTLKLMLSSGFILELLDVLYVPSLKESLISTSKLVKSGFSFIGDDESIRIYEKNKLDNVLGVCVLKSDIWQLLCDVCIVLSCSTIDREKQVKKPLLDEQSTMLWHRQLGHISKKRLERLVKEKILPNLDFSKLHNCDCYKVKLTNKRKLRIRVKNF